jgi:hypothetical protein
MSITYILCSLLFAAGGEAISPDASPSAGRTIEILIAGPREARDQMGAAIRPLFSADAEIRWTTEDKVPIDRGLPESDGQASGKTWQIWIDVSNPVRLHVYLPVRETTGATTVRTVARQGADGNGTNDPACDAAAQIVKAAVASLRRGPSTAPPTAPSERGESLSRHAAAGAHTHDGFFLRIQAGYGRLSAREDTGSRQYTKLGPSFSVAVGGKVLPNLLLFGELSMNGVVNSDERGSSETTSYSGPNSKELVLFVVGPGVAYYFMPVNVYLSTTIGLAKVKFVDGYTDEHVPDTGIGFAGSFSAGKEWWSSADWSVGLAARLIYARSMKHDYLVRDYPYGPHEDSSLHAATVALMFSATYN